MPVMPFLCRLILAADSLCKRGFLCKAAPVPNAFRRISIIALCIAAFLPRTTACADAAIDLGQRYPATLDRAQARKGYDWTCDAKDVWRLTGFSFSLGNQFRVELKAAQVVLGHHESNVLWAAVFPDQPGEIVDASAGRGEHITSIWLRFHPARLRELFPPPSVKGAGPEELIADAKRLAAHKMRACWQAGGKPTVPDQAVITVDLETREGSRRFFSINTVKSTIAYADAFKSRPLPIANRVDRNRALEVFDSVWNAFDREYAMFVLKPDVDWPKLRDEFRARLPAAKDDRSLADLLAEMLAHLQDLHVGVRVGDVEVPVYQRNRPLDANRQAVPKLLGPVTVAGHDLSWCVTADGIGYIAIDRLTDPNLSQGFDEVLENMERTRGLILDLRSNGGGSEPLGLEIAGSFLDGEHVYAKSQYRNGPRHVDLTPPMSRKCRPKESVALRGPRDRAARPTHDEFRRRARAHAVPMPPGDDVGRADGRFERQPARVERRSGHYRSSAALDRSRRPGTPVRRGRNFPPNRRQYAGSRFRRRRRSRLGRGARAITRCKVRGPGPDAAGGGSSPQSTAFREVERNVGDRLLPSGTHHLRKTVCYAPSDGCYN